MESLYLLIPLSVLAVIVAVLVFFWMNRNGQFDDDQGPAWSILLDDDRPAQSPVEAQENADGRRVDESPSKVDMVKADHDDPASASREP